MTTPAETSPGFGPALGDLLAAPPDQFDLDIRCGELGGAAPWADYLPTAGEQPGHETCDTHAATCAATCQPTCPETCHATCPATCRDTCDVTCGDTCVTCFETHCPTCRANCTQP